MPSPSQNSPSEQERDIRLLAGEYRTPAVADYLRSSGPSLEQATARYDAALIFVAKEILEIPETEFARFFSPDTKFGAVIRFAQWEVKEIETRLGIQVGLRFPNLAEASCAEVFAAVAKLLS